MTGRVAPFAAVLVALPILLGPAQGTATAQLRATLIASGFRNPLGFVQDPLNRDVRFVLEQAGRIRVLRGGDIQTPDFLDLTGQIASGGEQGLLGLAFAPDHATSRRLYVSFTDRQGHSVIARFRRAQGEPLRADPASRFDLLWPGGRRLIEQPFSNHNGGHLAFGPDGYLYIGLGDGGSGNDPFNNAQRGDTLLGKMLRIDVNVPDADPEGYNVPSTNPFVSRGDVLPEIWSVGLRNPWRWSFDDDPRGGTRAMVLADVGQGAWEEVDYEPAGASGRNYGWRLREGAHNNVTATPLFSQPLTDPIWEYGRGDGRSITGGYVYRGLGLGGSYRGRYFFADFVSSRVWSIALTVNAVTREATGGSLLDHTAELGAGAASPASFGEDADGELYLVSYGGSIFRIDGPGPDPGQPDPDPDTPPAPTRPTTGPPSGTARPRP